MAVPLRELVRSAILLAASLVALATTGFAVKLPRLRVGVAVTPKIESTTLFRADCTD